MLKTFPSSVVRVLVATFLSGIAMSLTFLFLNFHLEALGFTRDLIGYANAIPALSMVVFGVPAGLAIPRIGYVRSLYLSGACSVLGAILVAWAGNPWVVFVGLLAGGLGQGLAVGASVPLLTRLVAESQHVTVFSWQSALGTGAGFLGNMVGGFLPRLVGGPSGVMELVPFVLALSVLPLIGLHEVDSRSLPRFQVRHWNMWGKLILPPFIVSLGAGLVMPFLNLYLEEKFNLSYAAVGGIFAFSALATVAAMLVQPWLAGKFGKVGAIVTMQAASLPFILILAYVPFLPLVTLALFIRGALMNAANPVATALAMEYMAEEERATFTLVQAALWNVGWALGSSVSGRLQQGWGVDAFNYLFAGMLLLYTSATLLYLLFFDRHFLFRTAVQRSN